MTICGLNGASLKSGFSTRLSESPALYALEDLEGVLDVVILGDVYQRNRTAFSGTGPVVIEGLVELDTACGEPVIRSERVSRVES